MNASLLQAGCVAIDGRGLLILGPPGAGKSSLALALIDRGAALVGDDGVSLTTVDSRLFASPAPATAGQIEIRGLGLSRIEPAYGVPIALAILLDPEAPRFIERAERIELAGIALPQVRLWPHSPVLHLRAEWALRLYGTG